MRKAISRFASSFAALLVDQTTVIDADGRAETIRNAMLKAIHESYETKNEDAVRVWSSLSRASDIQTLWYLRSDVLRLLSAHHGETLARAQMTEMTELFRGVVSESQMPPVRKTR